MCKTEFATNFRSFDEKLVFQQMESSGTLAYYKLMQFGYPIKISINELFTKLQSHLEARHISIGAKNCCIVFLLSCGFGAKDFKIGKTEVHIRTGNFQLMDSLNEKFEQHNNDITVKFKEGFHVFMRRVLFKAFWFVGACNCLF